MPNIERNIKTGLQFWFWLLIMSLLLIPVAGIICLISIGALSLTGTIGVGRILVLGIVGLAEFILVLWVYGWVINTKVKRAQ